MNKYLFDIDEILDYDKERLQKFFPVVEGLKVSDLRVKDLVFFKGKDIRTGNGVYIFKENKKAIYVGNCSSRNFVERIPAHFDIRHNGWFNSLLVNLIKRKYQSNKNLKDHKTDKNLTEMAHLAFNNLELILINFPRYDKSAINKLEVFCKIALNPLNGFKHKILEDSSISIGEYIQYKSN